MSASKNTKELKGLSNRAFVNSVSTDSLANRNVVERLDNSAKVPKRNTFTTKACVIVLILLVLVGSAVTVGLLVGLPGLNRRSTAEEIIIPPSQMKKFTSAAVVSDSVPCAAAGEEMLLKNGSAVDAAIATLLCMGVYNGQSSGIGGGFFMTIFLNDTKQVRVIDARETAPLAAKQDMFEGDSSKAAHGPLSIAVPGEIKGMHEAHAKYGNLEWSDLFQPAIRLARDGFPAGMHLARALKNSRKLILNSPTLKEVFVNPKTNDVLKEGDWVKRPQLANTLHAIAVNKSEEFYSGETAKKLVKDIQDYGGIITLQDLKRYGANDKLPVKMSLKNGLTMYSVPNPGSGHILAFILKVLDQFDMTPSDLDSLENATLVYQRYIETLKFAYAMRTHLGDSDSDDVLKVLKRLESEDEARMVRYKIMDNKTFDPAYYGSLVGPEDHGTAHMSVIAPNGDAVSATNTINYWFGSGFRSPSTGIILNNEMDDFSAPNITNEFGLPPSPPNFIAPGRRPLSSMCPAIFVNAQGNAQLIIGAAGGTRITSAVALVSMKTLWLGKNIKEAIDDPRIHHQLLPNRIEYEPNFPGDILANLKNIGHDVNLSGAFGSVVVGIHRSNGSFYTNYDYRKSGSSAGF